MYHLKAELKMTEAEKKEALALEEVFFANGHKLLQEGGTVPKKTRDQIEAYYSRFLYPIHHTGWGNNLIQMELDDLKEDGVCRTNPNKRLWAMAYMIGWVAELPETLTVEEVFRTLSSRKAYRVLYQYAYEKV